MAIMMSINKDTGNIGAETLDAVMNNAQEAGSGYSERQVIAHLEELLNGATDEKFAELVQQLAQVGRKPLSVASLNKGQQEKIVEILELLETLKREVSAKKEEALEKSALIKAKVHGLVSSGKVQIHHDEYMKSDESVQQYAVLLNNIIAEIQNEEGTFVKMLSGDLSRYVLVYLYESNDFGRYVEDKVGFVRKYVKNIRKDLNVSYSRYSFGFEAQLKRILHVEHFIRYETAQNGNKPEAPLAEEK